MKVRTIGLVVVLLLAGLSTTVSAAEVGASGECYNEDASEGGEDEARVSTEDGITLLSVFGTINALATFAQGKAEDPNGTGCDRYDCGMGQGGACDEDQEPRKDYLEVHAEAQGQQVQVCYDNDPHVDTSYNCPTSPTGPGSS